MQKSVVSGVLLIDKPQGMTSQQVVSKVKYLLKSPEHDSKKAGHTGTLDPMATGLLPICLGESTKFSHYQLEAVKSYQAMIQLGLQTDTGDAEGQVIATAPVPNVSDDLLQTIAAQFLGPQTQVPPMYSALKKDGKKLYELAREGIDIEREARPITLHAVELTRAAYDQLQLSVTCSKGTYIRVVGEDIAKALGTVGHLVALRRTATGDFALKDAITLSGFEALSLDERLGALLPVDACVAMLPSLVLEDEQVGRVRQGQRLNVFNQATAQQRLPISTPNTEVRLFDTHSHFIGLAKLDANGRLQPVKLIQR